MSDVEDAPLLAILGPIFYYRILTQKVFKIFRMNRHSSSRDLHMLLQMANKKLMFCCEIPEMLGGLLNFSWITQIFSFGWTLVKLGKERHRHSFTVVVERKGRSWYDMQHRSLARIELWTLWFGGKLTLTIMPSGRPHQFFCAVLPSPAKRNTLCADAASSQPGAVVTKCQTWENQISNANGENIFHFTIPHQAALCNVRYRHQQHAQAYLMLTLSLWELSTYEEGMWDTVVFIRTILTRTKKIIVWFIIMSLQHILGVSGRAAATLQPKSFGINLRICVHSACVKVDGAFLASSSAGSLKVTVLGRSSSHKTVD